MTPEELLSTCAKSLIVRLVNDRGESWAGVISQTDVDESGGHLAVDLSRTAMLDLEEGQDARLRFVGLDPTTPLESWVQVLAIHDDAFRRRCHLRIGKRFGLVFGPESDRRVAQRVRPEPDAPLECFVHRLDERSRQRVSVYDLSATGIAVHVSGEQERSLFADWCVLLTLRLPAEPEVLTLVGDVAYRRKEPSGPIRYGIDFDTGETPDFERQQGRILRYVAARQIAQLRRLFGSPLQA